MLYRKIDSLNDELYKYNNSLYNKNFSKEENYAHTNSR